MGDILGIRHAQNGPRLIVIQNDDEAARLDKLIQE